ncbi:unnamed protein product [Ranitomeya imitator]|uniref:CCHC-type domain-containing protein n=1 Tax=Ranitomeya imitator TaxID=111125 RepID=A0ABN9M138_9NEOB|nr:unnamed protein product [Ranitomeya imitator]
MRNTVRIEVLERFRKEKEIRYVCNTVLLGILEFGREDIFCFQDNEQKVLDILTCLRRYCDEVTFQGNVKNAVGFWCGKRKFLVRLKKNPEGFGGTEHPPSTITIGKSRGYLFYTGMPMYCRNCGKMGHTQGNCVERRAFRCSNCGQFGHFMKDCPQKKACNLCGEVGHMFRGCPHRTKVRTYAEAAERPVPRQEPAIVPVHAELSIPRDRTGEAAEKAKGAEEKVGTEQECGGPQGGPPVSKSRKKGGGRTTQRLEQGDSPVGGVTLVSKVSNEAGVLEQSAPTMLAVGGTVAKTPVIPRDSSQQTAVFSPTGDGVDEVIVPDPEAPQEVRGHVAITEDDCTSELPEPSGKKLRGDTLLEANPESPDVCFPSGDMWLNTDSSGYPLPGSSDPQNIDSFSTLPDVIEEFMEVIEDISPPS